MIVQYWKHFFQGWEIEINETPTLETVFSRLENNSNIGKKNIYKIGQSVI